MIRRVSEYKTKLAKLKKNDQKYYNDCDCIDNPI